MKMKLKKKERMNILHLLMLHFIIVYVVDIAEFFDTIGQSSKRFKFLLQKPFNCAACMNVWIISGYSFLVLDFNILVSVFFGCLFSFLSILTSIVLFNIIDLIERKF